MTSPRKKPTAGFWITVALVAVLVGYPLSFGPACWAMTYLDSGRRLVSRTYHPLLLALCYGPPPIANAIYWYANAGIPDSKVVLFAGDDGKLWLATPK